MVVSKEQKTAVMKNVAIPDESNIKKKKHEIRKYQDLKGCDKKNYTKMRGRVGKTHKLPHGAPSLCVTVTCIPDWLLCCAVMHFA